MQGGRALYGDITPGAGRSHDGPTVLVSSLAEEGVGVFDLMVNLGR